MNSAFYNRKDYSLIQSNFRRHYKENSSVPHDDQQNKLPFRNSYEDVARSYQQLEEVKAQGLFGLWRVRWEKWLTKKAAVHIQEMEEANQIIMESKRKTAEKTMAAAQAIEAIHRDHDRQVIAAVESTQHRMIAEATLNQARFIPAPARSQSLISGMESHGSQATGMLSSSPPVRPYIVDGQIDKLARVFLSRFPIGDDFEEAWAAHELSLMSSIPAQVRAEVKERAKILLLPQASSSGAWEGSSVVSGGIEAP